MDRRSQVFLFLLVFGLAAFLGVNAALEKSRLTRRSSPPPPSLKNDDDASSSDESLEDLPVKANRTTMSEGTRTLGTNATMPGQGTVNPSDNTTEFVNGTSSLKPPESNSSSSSGAANATLSPSLEDVLSNATSNTTDEKTLRSLIHNLRSYVDKLYKSPVLSWLKNSYLVSIVVPILMGLCVALSLILVFILAVSLRRRFRRRRVAFKKKLPKAPDNMKQQDQVMLLAASSDDEF